MKKFRKSSLIRVINFQEGTTFHLTSFCFSSFKHDRNKTFGFSMILIHVNELFASFLMEYLKVQKKFTNKSN